jgi:2-isopropylmalate synthase
MWAIAREIQARSEQKRHIADDECVHKGPQSQVSVDAEHFFDAYKANPKYALSIAKAAYDSGARWVVLCDTNGGSLPSYVSHVVQAVRNQATDKIGVHIHNDGELAVANSLAAVEAGARQVQGTINGYGERCGNANLISIIPKLQLKMGYQCVPSHKIKLLTELSMLILAQGIHVEVVP